MKEGLGGGSEPNSSAFDGETSNSANRLDLKWYFIAAYCERKRFDTVRLAQCG